MARLSLDQIQQQLQDLQGWKFGNNAITKQFTLKGFGAAGVVSEKDIALAKQIEAAARP